MSENPTEELPNGANEAPQTEVRQKGQRPKSGLNALMRFFGMVSGGDQGDEGAMQVTDSAVARSLIDHALAFQALRVSDVMTPRADIIAVELSTPLKDVLKLCVDSEHSRLPIFRETLDDPVGVLHIKDLLKALAPTKDDGLTNWNDPLCALIDDGFRTFVIDAN
jgi:CBS domain containing-hemolysin-like protein